MQKLPFPLALIICIFACCCPSCATRPSVPVIAPSPLRSTMVVVSGQARIQSGGGHILVAEGQEAVITAGDQITAGEDGLKLLLANGSSLYLNPGTELQVVTFSAEGTVKLGQLKGRLEVEATSPLLAVEISTTFVDNFVLKTMRFTATPTVRNTTFQLWLDGVDVHLTVESGEVQVTSDDRTETIRAGSEVKASPGGELVVSQGEPPVEPTVTTVVPTMTPDLTRLSPTDTAVAIVAPKYPAPDLIGPDDGSEFKGDEEILLIWDTPTPLSEGEWYEVQLWREGDVPYTVVQRTKEGTWKVEPKYFPGRYQWRILIVRSQEGQKEILSPPSDTRRFSWLSRVETPTPPTGPSFSGAVDLTIYLRGTNNAQGFATFSGEQVNAVAIYSEGDTIYGEVAVRIGDTVYHFDQDPEPVGVEQLPDPYHLEVQFSDSLLAATGSMQPGFNPKKAQFWVGTLNCNSATQDKPYKIEMTLYAGGEARKHAEISFLVADDPLCGGTPETERIWQPPPTYTPTPLYSPTPTPTPSCDLTVYLRGTNNAEGFAAFSGEHVDAGRIYTEGGYVYGEIAVRIGSREYHYYEQGVCLPPRRDDLPFRVEFKFSDSLLAATKDVQPGFDRSNLRFWAGVLDCNSAIPPDKPYKIEATLYEEEKIRKHTEIRFLVADDPLCGSE